MEISNNSDHLDDRMNEGSSSDEYTPTENERDFNNRQEHKYDANSNNPEYKDNNVATQNHKLVTFQ